MSATPTVPSVDPRDVFYLVSGIAFFGLTVLPRVRAVPFIAAPPLYVAAGALLALTPLALSLPDPLADGPMAIDPLKVVEHASELIVIVSLTGAGLAIDTPLGRGSWAPVWPQLVVTMPLTIAAVALGGWWIGLPIATALLLAAALAPTDPVLARSVQVGRPTEGGEGTVQLGLTGEAGLNDGLAFPFVHLAVAVAGLASAPSWSGLWTQGWFLRWLGFDLLYRVLAAAAIGWVFGHWTARLVYSRWGDAGGEETERGENAGLTMMAATFACYGLVEMLSAYGFLAVFVSAVAGRSYARGHAGRDPYVQGPHRFSEQFEALLLALLLLWLGGLAATGLFAGWRWSEAALALALLLVVRPLAGTLAAAGTACTWPERLALGCYGIRGMGSVFYLAYGASHAEFEGMAAAWRIAAFAILGSILLHGLSARPVMARVERVVADRSSERGPPTTTGPEGRRREESP